MRGITLFSVLLCLSTITINAQISEGGKPKSYFLQKLKSTQKTSRMVLNRLNIDKLISEDKNDVIPLRYAVFEDVDIDVKSDGTKTYLEDGMIWQYKLQSKNAQSIGIQFGEYNIPEGATMFIFSPDYKTIHGAFTSRNNKSNGHLSLAEFPGKELVIEYYEPFHTEFEGKVKIAKIGQSYRDVYNATEFTEDDGYIDINCPEGDPYQLEKLSVTRITFEEAGSGYLCSGSLINNVNNDGTPYYLTANHCLSTNESAKTVIGYFNYERIDCGGEILNPQSLSGATLAATNPKTDFTLLEFDDQPPLDYHPYYAGWNALSDSIVNSGIGIHHPGGDVKKISIDYKEITVDQETIYWSDGTKSEPFTHWRVILDKGLASQGSSGSPLFDENNRIIGQLHGGTTFDKNYGMLSLSWDDDPLSYRSLKNWLDPDNTGIRLHDGYFPANQNVKAHFYTDFQSVCVGEPVQLYDGSLFGPDQWEWSFDPSSVTYYESTNKNSQNPVVSFNENTAYSITLNVSNSQSSDSRTRPFYIQSNVQLALEIIPTFRTIMCASDFKDNYKLIAKGAETYNWEIKNQNDIIIIDSASLNTDTLKFAKNDTITTDSILIINIKLTGRHGESCSDSVFKEIKIISVKNDSIHQATGLEKGLNGPFYNLCAGREQFEDNPPPGSCNSQSTWCECDGDMLIENSVWFTFEGPESGLVTLDAPGFDNQIAVYEAETSADIISGDTSRFKIIAANDDFWDEDKFYAALVYNVTVTPGKTYWLQVDGSACGDEGEFYLNVIDSLYTTTTSVNSNILNPQNIRIYPNPATDQVTIENNSEDPVKKVYLYSLDGKLVRTYDIQNERISRILMPDYLNNGLYFVSIVTAKTTIQKTIIIRK